MIHIPDKRALYQDIHRVLVPGGWMVLSDWFGNGLEPTSAMREWLDVVGLTFRLESIEVSAALVEACGFREIEWRDRNAWYAGVVDEELATLRGDNYPRLVERLGTRGGGAAAREHVQEEGRRGRRRAAPGAPARAQARLSGLGGRGIGKCGWRSGSRLRPLRVSPRRRVRATPRLRRRGRAARPPAAASRALARSARSGRW